MLEKIILKCRYKRNLKGHTTQITSSRRIAGNAAPRNGEALHQGNLRPFSQYVVMGTQNELSWHIGLWMRK